MKEDQLREHAKCDICGKGIGASGLPLLWTVRVERHGLKLDSLQRQQGLTMMLGGNAGLARIMGADEDMTTPLMDPVELTVCETCGTRTTCVAALGELGTAKAEQEKELQQQDGREKEGGDDAS